MILLPRGWVVIEGKALFRACIELIPRKYFLNLFCVVLKAEEIRPLPVFEDPFLNFMNGRFGEQYHRVGICES